ncbi:MAG TPA: segregation/condensation protein A [Acidobacteriota bacterium]|nr:segregation/condensation protein A [Acidobacteriota bacterium]
MSNAISSKSFMEQLIKEDDIAWKSLILEAVSSNQMDPWDINLGEIASLFLEMVKEYKKMNFKLSGKVILASALLLKLKSHKFVNQDILFLDQLIASTQSDENDMPDEPFEEGGIMINPLIGEIAEAEPALYPRTPQPRKRKVSVYDLIKALEQALEVNRRREMRTVSGAPDVHIPKKNFDITVSIDTVYKSVARHYLNSETAPHLTFSQLIPSEDRNDKLYTFIPLLHLRNMKKVDLEQQEHFGDFSIHLISKNAKEEITKELTATVTQEVPQ